MDVVNKYKATEEQKKIAKYIGRPSVLQNPFPITDSCDRDRSVFLFRRYLIRKLTERDEKIIQATESLSEDDVLMCYCKPKACHGDVIKEFWTFFQSYGGVRVSLDLFDWTYGPEIEKEPIMAEENKASTWEPGDLNVVAQKLLVIEHPEHRTLDDDDKAVQMYRRHIYRCIMNRDPEVENLIQACLEKDRFEDIVPMNDYEAKKIVAVCGILSEVRIGVEQFGSYDEMVRNFRKEHNHDRIDFNPADDGVTHINVYSRGRTELGRLLSNFANTPFKHPEHGYFCSVEAFWYWLALGKKEGNIRTLHGISAKKAGIAVRETMLKNGNKAPVVENFEAEIKSAILCKIEQNDRLRELLKNSTLPLTHYYVWGDGENYKITYPEKYSWIHEYIEDVRQYLNGHAHKVVIAGSRGIDSLDFVKQTFESTGIKAIQIISGTARGIDKNGEQLAAELKIPCLKMPADWDTHQKAAGFIRNDEMAKVATFAILIWDGKSNGTKQMIERCKFHEVKMVMIKVENG